MNFLNFCNNAKNILGVRGTLTENKPSGGFLEILSVEQQLSLPLKGM